MGKQGVVFRADGHVRMGLGHLVRSAALAEMLAPDFDCHLVYRHCPEALLLNWKGIFSNTLALEDTLDVEDEAAALVNYASNLGAGRSIVVLDGYHFDTDYQRVIVQAGHKLVCIDDIHQTEFLAHLVINHGPAASIQDYSAADYTQFALGLRFALLRAPFREVARKSGSPVARNRIFICLGGADPDNAILEVLDVLADLGVKEPIDLVIGSAYRHQDSLNAFMGRTTLNIEVHHQLSATEMVGLMSASQYGITSPSTVSIEYLSTGGQLYLKQIADNQTEIRNALIQMGVARDISALQTGSVTGAAIPRTSPVLDGQQDIRLRKLFTAIDLTYRKAVALDSEVYLQWANDELVRAQSFDSRPIAPEVHRAWFDRKINDPHSELLVFERDKVPVGQVRIGIAGNEAVIGYSVAAEARGGGIGLAMLHFAENHLLRHRPDVNRITGFVKKSNVASLVTFRRLGYEELATEDYPNAVKFERNEL